VWDVRRSVLVASFQESSVPFTLEQLRELHAKFPSIRDSLFAHESCDSEFLSAHFEEAFSRSRQTDYMILASICSNTNTPHKLLELVANAKDVPVGAVYPARNTLEKIRREQKRADQPATKPAEKPPVKDPPSTPASKDVGGHLDVGIQMKTRPIIILGIVAFIAVIAWRPSSVHQCHIHPK
jgi:hypothetical protein